MNNFTTTTLAVLLAATTLSRADVEDDIFKSGVTKTLEVMAYQKKLSLSQKKWGGKFCYKLNPPAGETEISDFLVIKLEALSLIADTKPLYYGDNKGNKNLCFFVTDTAEGYTANKKRIEEKFESINKFSPKKVKLSKHQKIIPIVPTLGKWNNDMTNTIAVLNEKISTLEGQNKTCQSSLDKVLDAVGGIPDTVNKVVKEIKSGVGIKRKNQSATPQRDSAASKKEIVNIPASVTHKMKTDNTKKKPKKMLI